MTITICSTKTLKQIQFCLIIVQCTFALYNECDMPRMLIYIYIPNVLFIFYMFYNFFNVAYPNAQNKKTDAEFVEYAAADQPERKINAMRIADDSENESDKIKYE